MYDETVFDQACRHRSGIGIATLRTSTNDRIDLERLKEEVKAEFAGVLEDLRKDHPKVVEGAATLVGGTLGGSVSLTALFFGGSVTGLSAAGITSALGRRERSSGVYGRGIGVLAAPVAVLAVGGYAIAKRRAERQSSPWHSAPRSRSCIESRNG